MRCDGLFFRSYFAFEAVVEIKAFAASGQCFKVARAAAVVGQYAGDQCGIVLRHGGYQVLVDAQSQRLETLEYVKLTVNMIGDHIGLFLFTHGLHGGF